MELFSGKWVLDDLALVSFSGSDAANFLHSQITNSVIDLADSQARPMAYCTAQGRLLANGFFWRLDSDSIALVIAKDLLESFIKRMKMFVLRSKVKIDHLSKYKIIGISGKENSPLALQDMSAWSCHLDDKGYWIKAPTNSVQSDDAWLISDGVVDNNFNSTEQSAWYANRLAHGWPLIRLATKEKFLPNALNMDINGSIDFKKGCYPGQEIIARSHYRGKVKRRLAFVYGDIPDGNSALDLTDLYSASTKKPIARIIESAVFNKRIYISAEVNLADLDDQIYLLTENGPELKVNLIE